MGGLNLINPFNGTKKWSVRPFTFGRRVISYRLFSLERNIWPMVTLATEFRTGPRRCPLVKEKQIQCDQILKANLSTAVSKQPSRFTRKA